VTAHGMGQKLSCLFVPVDDILGVERMRIHERVDVGDHRYQSMIPVSAGVWHLQSGTFAPIVRIHGTVWYVYLAPDGDR
jgi:hypothetical protein